MIRRLPATYDVEELRREAELAHEPFVVLDDVASAADFHDAVARALGFPAYYGHNLDALADCLRDVDARTVLLWASWSGLAEDEPRVFEGALGLLGEAITVLLPERP